MLDFKNKIFFRIFLKIFRNFKLTKPNSRGFTLLEIILVLGILGIISLLAINSYGIYRKNIILDLGTDDFISQLESAKFQSRLGKTDSVRYLELVGELSGFEPRSGDTFPDSFCYGILLEKDGDNFLAQTFQQKFINKKSWNSNLESFEFLGCNGDYLSLTSQDFILEPLTLEEGLAIKEISESTSDGASLATINDYFLVRFSPPTGDLDLEFDGQTFSNTKLSEVEGGLIFDFLFQFAEDEDRQQNLKLIFNKNDFQAQKQ